MTDANRTKGIVDDVVLVNNDDDDDEEGALVVNMMETGRRVEG
jgi:hypothetical protein